MVQTVDAQFRPLESYVRVAKAGLRSGSGWFHFSARHVDMLACADSGEARPRRPPLERATRAFGSYPLAIDGWMATLFDPHDPRRQVLPDTSVSSLEFDGAGTVECLPIRFGMEHLGVESVTMAAGTFRCDHYRHLLDGSGIDHPPYETWVTADGEHTIVRACVGGPLNYSYELVHWR